MQQVRAERTGWRDLGLSERHRRWGWNLPAVDLDFLFLEYDKGKAVAIVEYKHENAQIQDPKHPTYLAIKDLGNRAGIPVFGCRYANDYSWYRVTSLNPKAKEWINGQTVMTEREWVTFLYQIRGYELPKDTFDNDGTLI